MRDRENSYLTLVNSVRSIANQGKVPNKEK